MKRILALSATALLVAACDQNTSNTNITSDTENHNLSPSGEKVTPQAGQFFVTSTEGQAIAGAQVLIGTAPGQPFAGNTVTADAQGRVSLPSQWTSALPVTIKAPGFITATFDSQSPGRMSYELRPAPVRSTVTLSGNLTNFGPLPRDGKLDFGIAFPALTRQDLFSFDIGSILSTQMDTIEVLGQKVEIPGNLTLPTQRERYGIVPLNFNKNNYSLNFSELGQQRVVAIRGQFDVSDVIGEFRKGSNYTELVKYFRFIGGTIDTVNLSSPRNTKHIPVDRVAFNKGLRFTAPSVDRDEVVLAVVASESQGAMVPTGIGVLNSGEVKVLSATDQLGTPVLVTVRKKRADFEQKPEVPRDPDTLFTLSATLTNIAAVNAPQNLGLVDQPRITSPTSIALRPPAPLSGVTPTATYVTLSRIEKVPQGSGTVERKTVVWEHYAHGWKNSVDLPTFSTSPVQPGLEYRWEASFIGQATGEKANLGSKIFDRATHVSISAKSF